MEMQMVLLAVGALAVAVVATTVAVVLLRDNRRRSEARIAALAMLSAESAPATPPAPTPARLFRQHAEPSPWPRRALVIVACSTGVAVLIGLAAARRPAAQAPAETGGAAGMPAKTSPLELVSLRHEQSGPSLVVTGLVQNPDTAEAAAHVQATVFAFEADGTFVASGRAPIEFARLGPGDQSPFVVTVPSAPNVARYRVGFRSQDGRVITHVDKRAPQPLARRDTP